MSTQCCLQKLPLNNRFFLTEQQGIVHTMSATSSFVCLSNRRFVTKGENNVWFKFVHKTHSSANVGLEMDVINAPTLCV